MGGAIVHHVSGSPSTRTSNVSTISPWLRIVASTVTSVPGTTGTVTAAPASSSPRAGSRSVSSVEGRGTGGAGGRYVAGSEASVAVGSVVSSQLRYSPHEQKSRLTATVPHFGHSSSVPTVSERMGVVSAGAQRVLRPAATS